MFYSSQAGQAAGIDDVTIQEVMKQMTSPEIKERLKEVTNEALEHGVSIGVIYWLTTRPFKVNVRLGFVQNLRTKTIWKYIDVIMW